MSGTAVEKYEGVGSRLQQFAADGAAAYELAFNIASTPFVPDSYKSKGPRNNKTWFSKEQVAYNVTAAWLAGAEIGLQPMQSLQSLDIIEGRPALNVAAQRALVQAAGHEIWVAEQKVDGRSSISVTVAGKRAGSDHVEEATYTLDMARQAGLLEKTNWQNNPLDMCIARASSRVCRRIASDVLLGLAYSAEELEDEVDRKPQEVEFERTRAVEETPAVQPVVEIDAAKVEDESAPAEEPEECGVPKPGEGSRRCNRPAYHEGKHFYGRTVEEEPEVLARPADPEESEPEIRADVADPEEEAPLFEEPSEEEQAAAAEADLAAKQPAVEEPPVEAPVDDDPWADFQ